jgi:hypothetical protein
MKRNKDRSTPERVFDDQVASEKVIYLMNHKIITQRESDRKERKKKVF